MIDTIKSLLFPVRCPYCNRVIEKNEYACINCKKKFPQSAIRRYAFGGIECCSAFPYSTIFADAVKRFKFANLGSYAKQLAFPLVQSIIEVYGNTEFDIITCVPMHKTMQRKRGYNQAELLAVECANIMNIPYVNTLEKHKLNRAQHTVKANEREENVRGVYKAIQPDLIKGKNVLIIDDIVTTGHTLGECAKILKNSGCRCVCCAVVCSV